MSLQERTLVIKNFDPEKTTLKLLKELCVQGGPVRNVVIKPDHAFVEYEDVESVGYSKALLDGILLFGRKLVMEPKTKDAGYFKYTRVLHDYIKFDKQQQQQQQMVQQQQLLVQEQIRYYGNQFVQPLNLQVMSDPMLQSPINYAQGSQTQIFGQFVQNLPNFPPPDNMQPNRPQPTQMPRSQNDNFRRSRSFNHNNNQRHDQHQKPHQGSHHSGSWSDRDKYMGRSNRSNRRR